MVRRIAIPLTVVFCCATALPHGIARAQRPGSRFDIAYFRSGDLWRIRAYRRMVARVLGPRLGKRLRVVKGPSLYGLIYDRDGDLRGTRKLARAHTRLLRSRGLGPAVAIPDRDWSVLSSARRGLLGEPAFRGRLEFERAVETAVKRLRREGRIGRDERTAWSVYDLASGETLVDLSEDRRFQAASMAKPFFALAFFHKVREGKLHYGPKSRHMMTRMIQYSDNDAANWVLRHIGGPRAAQRLLKRRYGRILRDVDIVEYIPRGGRTYRNKASVEDYSRFLAALWDDRLPGSREMKRLMALPNKDRLYTGVRSIPRGTKVYNKTGSTKHLCGDMGILVARGRDGRRYPYVIVGLIQKRRSAGNYTSWIRSRGEVIRDISGLVYRKMERRHDLRSGTQIASR